MLEQWNVFSPSRKVLKKAKALADKVDSLKKEYRAKSNAELSNMTNVFHEKLKKGYSLDDILPEAFATVREAIYRVHHLFAFKVQLIGAIVTHQGDFAEMYTGEGKTLVVTMVAYLNALLQRGVHVVTVNEYLVQRDAKFCAEALNPLGITVGYNLASFNSDQKRKMYACDITYTTNAELGFDYLRDNMVQKYEDKVIKELNFAIIDEADSVLIDEARTPLIISGQPKEDVSNYIEADEFVQTLIPDDYTIDHESNSINLTDSGVLKAEKFFKTTNLFNFENSDIYHKIKNALMANKVFRRGVEYIVDKENKIALVDQFTGRILEGRSYNAGLQQAIQAKEKVKIEPENVTVATITYQSFFRLYRKLAGVSGTAATEAEEFLKIYNMIVVTIPTNRPVIRKDLNDYVFANKISKWAHVVDEIERIHKTGQPILVGTESVDDSEELVYFLKNKGLNFQLLNAKNNAKEALIVANAGQKGMITISTNMAGRGTDIKLGPGVAELGGLYVIGTAHHESRRVDNQLRGRSGRQGDPGKTRFFVSLEDTLFRRFAIEKENKADKKIDNDYFDSWFFTRLIKNAQKKVEAFNFDSRKNLIDYDSVTSNQRELIYKQRDQILLNKTNIDIAKKMSRIVANDIVQLFKNPQNPLFVEPTKLANVINGRLFGVKLVSEKFFTNKTVEQATTILCSIINLSIDARVKLLTEEKANKIFRDIMIQSLDRQWTEHLDLTSKVREGVTLRSLEQRSPLNIYVDEVDKHFETLKKNVAHNVIININHIYVPKVNEEIFNLLSSILSDLDISNEAYNEAKENIAQQTINTAFGNANNMMMKFTPSQSMTKVVSSEKPTEPKENNKTILMQKMAELKAKQNSTQKSVSAKIDTNNVEPIKVAKTKVESVKKQPIQKTLTTNPTNNKTDDKIDVNKINTVTTNKSIKQSIKKSDLDAIASIEPWDSKK